MNNDVIEKINLTKAGSRYIVPFKILPVTASHSESNSSVQSSSDNECSVDVYSIISNSLNKSEDWQQLKTNTDLVRFMSHDNNDSESSKLKTDLYKHILKTLSINTEASDHPGCSIGASWEYTPLLQQSFRPVVQCNITVCTSSQNIPVLQDDENLSEKTFEFEISRAGIFIFRTGIGIFWFEVKNSSREDLSPFTKIEDFIAFQHSFKELSAPWLKDRFILVNSVQKDENSKYFVTGKWITDVLDSILSENDGNSLRIEFYSSREYAVSDEQTAESASQTKYRILPDKAILFNLAVMKPNNEHYFEDIRKELTHIGFMLSNGFNVSYLMPDNIEQLVLQPFSNVLWHASSFGMGQFIVYNKTNSFFFENILPDRMFSDYFIIYIILLYQQYSILFYTEQLELTFPADLNKISLNSLQNYSEKINMFLIKSVYASVSHLEQHNNVYRYIGKTLCIKDNINDLTVGLDSLSEIIRNKNSDEDAEREKQISNSLNSLALVVIASALTDTYAFLDNDVPDLINGLFRNNYIPEQNQPYCWFVIKLFFILLLVILFIKVFGKIYMQKKANKKGNKGKDLKHLYKKFTSVRDQK